MAGMAQHGRDFSVAPYFLCYLCLAAMEWPSAWQAVLDVIDADDFPVAALLLQLEMNVIRGTVARDADSESRSVDPI